MRKDYDTDKVSLKDLSIMILRRYKLFLAIVVLGILGSLVYVKTRPMYYTSSATISIESLANLTTWSDSKISGVKFPTETSFLKNNETISSALDAMRENSKSVPTAVKPDALKGAIGFSTQSGTNLTAVTFSHSDRDFTVNFLDYLLKSYSDELQNYSNSLLEKEYDARKDALFILNQKSNELSQSAQTLAEKNGGGLGTSTINPIDTRLMSNAESLLLYPELYNVLLQYQKVMTSLIDANTKLSSLEAYMDDVKPAVQIIENPRIVYQGTGNHDTFSLALGLVLGLAVGFFSVVLLDYFSNTINSPRDVRKIIGPEPHIHMLPSSSNSSKSSLIKSKGNSAEAILPLSNILSCSGKKIITISALNPGEKSAVMTMKIASQVAAQGKSVLVIGLMYEQKVYTTLTEKFPSIKVVKDDDIKKLENDTQPKAMILVDAEQSSLFNAQQLKSPLEEFKNTFDLILIHGPSFQTPSALLSIVGLSEQFYITVRECVSSKERLAELYELCLQCDVSFEGVGLITQQRNLGRKERLLIQQLAEGTISKDNSTEAASVVLY